LAQGEAGNNFSMCKPCAVHLNSTSGSFKPATLKGKWRSQTDFNVYDIEDAGQTESHLSSGAILLERLSPGCSWRRSQLLVSFMGHLHNRDRYAIDMSSSTTSQITWRSPSSGEQEIWERIDNQSWKKVTVLLTGSREQQGIRLTCKEQNGQEMFSFFVESAETTTWMQARLSMASALRPYLSRCRLDFALPNGDLLTPTQDCQPLAEIFKVHAANSQLLKRRLLLEAPLNCSRKRSRLVDADDALLLRTSRARPPCKRRHGRAAVTGSAASKRCCTQARATVEITSQLSGTLAIIGHL